MAPTLSPQSAIHSTTHTAARSSPGVLVIGGGLAGRSVVLPVRLPEAPAAALERGLRRVWRLVRRGAE